MTDVTVETAIIGAGQAGVPLARSLAGAGRTVALIEREHLGGSCVNFGCTPSKAMIASARLAADARRAADWGLRIPEVSVDFGAVMDRVRGMVADAKGSLDRSFAAARNPHVIAAHGRLDGRDGTRFRIRAGGELVLADRVVLDTGTRSALPDLEGLDGVPFVTAETWVALTALPRRLVLLGGGYVALEMAQAYRRLGAEVVVVQSGRQLAEQEDLDVATALQEALEADGIDVRLDAHAIRVEPAADGVRVHLAHGAAVDGTHLFVATGRQPNTDDLGLDTVGVQVDGKGAVRVDAHLATTTSGIWAAGDIRGGPAFTQTAVDDFKVLESCFAGDGSRARCRIVPYAMFTDPELGRVGLTEAEARRSGRPVAVGRRDMADSGKARELGKTRGFIKVVLDAASGEILGAAALCIGGSEVVQLFVELMNAGATAHTMTDAVHIHPTLAEAAKNATLAALEDRWPLQR